MTVGAGWKRGLCVMGTLLSAGVVASAAACRGENANAGTASTNATERAQDSTVAGGGQMGGTKDGTVSAPAAALRVVFMGTSLTAGYGLETSEAFPALVQRKADSAGVRISVINAGVSGETSAGALRRVDWVLRDPADLFVLETGANDGLRGQSVAQLDANLTAIIGRVQAKYPDARVALAQMEAMSNMGAPYTRAFHDVYPRVAKATGVTLLPFILDGVAGERTLNQADGVHPNEAGERIVAANVWRALRPALEASPAAEGRSASR